MANANGNKTWFVDTNDTTLSSVRRIKSIIYVGNTSGTLVIKHGTSGGVTCVKLSGATDIAVPGIDLHTPEGVHIALTNSAEVIIIGE